MNIAQLEAKRRAAQRQIEQLQAPARAAEAAQAELEALEQQIAAVRLQEQNEARERQQHQNNVHAARLEYEAIAPALVAELRKIHIGRLRLIDLGEPDPGDRVLSVEAIVVPIVERDQRANAIEREMWMRDRATDAEVEAYHDYRALVERLHVPARPWSEAERLAGLVTDGVMTEDEAHQSLREETEDVEV